MATPNELEEAIKGWVSLECTHCGKLNPLDVVKCIYCSCIIRRRAALKLWVGRIEELTEWY